MGKPTSREKRKQIISEREVVIGWNIIDAVKKEPPQKRVGKLVELGVLTDIEGYTWGTMLGSRFFVLANVKGVPIPMYKSLHHTGDKRQDLDFFCFLGIGNGNWAIKGFSDEVEKFYGIEELENASEILTSVFDFDTSRKNGTGEEATNGYIPQGKEIQDDKKLNALLSARFNIDPSRLSGATYQIWSYVSEKIFNEVKKANLEKHRKKS